MKVLSPLSSTYLLQENKSDFRNDPYFYNEKLVIIYNFIKAKTTYKIGDFFNMFTGVSPPGDYTNKGIPFIRIQDLEPFGVFPESLVRIREQDVRGSAIKVQKYDVLLAITGATIGKVSIYLSDEPAFCTSDILILRPKKELSIEDVFGIYTLFLSPQYLLIFKRGVTGVSNQHLSPKYVNQIPIILDKKVREIGNKLKQAIEAKIEAEKKRKEVGGIFERNLGNVEVRKLGGYVFKLSHCLEVGRLDPHFYYPEFLKVLDLLNNSGFEIKRMSELVEFSKETTNPSNTIQFVYVEIADVDLRYGFISSHSIVKGSNAPSRARKIIRKGALLIPLTRPYRGAIAVVDSRYNDAITTTGFSVSYPKSDSPLDSYYLCAFLKSPYGLIQLIQRMSNANYPAILEDDIADILVPILSNDIKTVSANMKEIVDNLLLSKQLHSQAMEELNELLGLNSGGDKP